MKKLLLWLAFAFAVSQIGIFAYFAGRAASVGMLGFAYVCFGIVVVFVILAAAALDDLGIIEMPGTFNR